MMPVIRVGDQTWERLKKWAEPLVDTPDDALRKVLDAADEHLKCAGLTPVGVAGLETKELGLFEKQPKGKKIPQQDFNRPILETLYDLGGKGRASEVLPMVESKMKHLLGEFDYQTLPSGDIRWQKTANWARYWLTKRGLLKADSYRGVWELTEQGKKVVENKRSDREGKSRRDG